jgi:hypothetical protein
MPNPAWLLTITNAADQSGAPKTLRFSDVGYVDGANNLYEQRLMAAGLVRVSPNDGGVLKIFGDASVGEMELVNSDYGLNYLAGYAIDGRACSLDLFDGVSTVTNYFSGTCAGKSERDGKIYISLRTLKDTLDTDHPLSTYLGNNVLPNGVDGLEADLKGAVKPKPFGKVLNQTPKLVNTAKLIGQVSSRATTVINTLYDRGVALTKGADYADLAAMQATAPSAGQFRCFQGYYRLGSQPTGTITVDSQDAAGVLAGDAFKAICDERSVAVNAASVTLLNAIGEVGLLVENTTSTTELLSKLISGLGAYWYFIGSTIFVAKYALATVSTFELNAWQIVKLERKATGLGDAGLPYSSVEMQCDEIATVQNDLAGSVPADRVARMSQQWRKAEAASSTTKTRHPLSKTLKIDSCLRSVSAAQAVCNSIRDLVAAGVDVVTIEAAFSTLPPLVIGAGFTLIPRGQINPKTGLMQRELGYDNGKLLTIIGYEVDQKNNSATIEAIG